MAHETIFDPSVACIANTNNNNKIVNIVHLWILLI